MASKNKTQVLIGGKIYTMSGYESEEYLQRVAAYLNNKITEIKTSEGYTRMSQEMRGLLLNLNTADDYFKLKEKSDQLSESLSAKDKELYEIKHELISTQMKQDSLTRELEIEKEDHQEAQRELTQLRTRLQDALDALKAVERQAAAGAPAEPKVAEDVIPEKAAQEDAAPEPEQAEAAKEETPEQETPAEVMEEVSGPEKSGLGNKKQKYNRYYRK